jgi:hypothetical protein
MAIQNIASQWYWGSDGQNVRPKYLFDVVFYSMSNTQLQEQSKLTVRSLRTIELPRYNIENEVVNAWNVRQVVPTKIQYDPISITFTDTVDNKFHKFIKTYLSEISTNFDTEQVQASMKSRRTGLDGFGLKVRPDMGDTVFEKLDIVKFYRDKSSTTTLWRPRIIDVQNDSLDYAASEALVWTISLRYEAVTYSESNNVAGATANNTPPDLMNWYG